MVRGIQGHAGFGFGGADELLRAIIYDKNRRASYSSFHVFLKNHDDWFDGFSGLLSLAEALTAPWPPLPAPIRETRAFNLVELIGGEDDCAFDQPCAFGHRVNGHAVYCHNEI